MSADPRLKQPLRVEAEGVAIGELLTRIAAVSGVTVSAERSLADEKVVVLGPPRPVSDILDDLGVLLHAAWEKDAAERVDAAPRYVLLYVPGARKYEDLLRKESALRRLRILLDPASGDKSDAPWRNLWAARNTKPENRAACALLRRLPEAQQLALLNGQRIFVPSSVLNPTEKLAANTLAGQAAQMEAEMTADDRAHGFDAPPVEATPAKANSTGVWLESDQDNVKTMVFLRQGNFQQWFGTVANRDGFGLPSHGSPYADQNVPPITTDAENAPDVLLVEAAAKNTEPWAERLRRLADLTKRPIVADFYRTAPVAILPDAALPATTTKNTDAAMDAFCRDAGFVWWTAPYPGKTLFFRKRDWYEQKAYEIPDRWYDGLAVRLARQKGVPTFGDVVRLTSELTETQMSGLILGPVRAKPKTREEERSETLTWWARSRAQKVQDLLLVLRAASVPSRALVPSMRELTPKQRSTLWISTARSTPAQKAAWADFMEDSSLQSETRWAFCITRDSGLPLPKNAPMPETVPLLLRYQIGQSQRIYFLTLPLPLHAPNDKRAQMRVDLVSQ